MEREGHENYTRIISLLMEGGTFIARELLKRETKKKEGNLKDFLKDHAEQLKRRFTQEQMNDIGLAFTEDWNVVLLTGMSFKVT
jgi:bacterioferritin (cytochrome b1)